MQYTTYGGIIYIGQLGIVLIVLQIRALRLFFKSSTALKGVVYMEKKEKKMTNLEKISIKMTEWVGTPMSLVIHSLAFMGIFSLRFFGIPIEEILLILTTAVSLEAIYLAIFIQMTVNRNTESIEDLQEDVEDIQEDVEDLEEGIGKGLSTTGKRIQKFLGLKH